MDHDNGLYRYEQKHSNRMKQISNWILSTGTALSLKTEGCLIVALIDAAL